MRLFLPLAGALLIGLPIAQADAQLAGKVKVRAGIGVKTRPDYLGADNNSIAPFPHFAVAFGDQPFGVGAPDDSFGIKLIHTGGFSAGPVARLRRGRNDSDVGAPVGDVGRTVELGGYLQQYLGQSVRLRGELRKGIGGHEGIVGSIGADYVARDGDNYVFTIGPRVHFSDSKFQRAFFGVSPAAALASGLDPYRPGGGIHSVGAIAGADYQIGGGWGLFGFARYDRLVGDARKSPIIRQFGSPDQFSAGVGISRSFTIDF